MLAVENGGSAACLSCGLVMESALLGVNSELKYALRFLNGGNEKIVWF